MTQRPVAWRRLWVSAAVVAALASHCFGQAGPLVETAAKELCVQLVRRGGATAAEQLARVGGETAARELLEQAAKEGGEALVKEASEFVLAHGAEALPALKAAPGKLLPAFKSMAPELLEPAIRATVREPEVVTRLVSTFGKGALEVAAEHPGVGTRLVETFGEDGIQLGRKLSTDDVIRLLRHSDEIKRLPPAERGQLLGALKEKSAGILDYLESHPGVLLTAGGVAVAIAAKDNIFGVSGSTQPGLVERVTHDVAQIFKTPITAILVIVGIAIAAWAAIQLWHLWRVKRIRQRVVERQTHPHHETEASKS